MDAALVALVLNPSKPWVPVYRPVEAAENGNHRQREPSKRLGSGTVINRRRTAMGTPENTVGMKNDPTTVSPQDVAS